MSHRGGGETTRPSEEKGANVSPKINTVACQHSMAPLLSSLVRWAPSAFGNILLAQATVWRRCVALNSTPLCSPLAQCDSYCLPTDCLSLASSLGDSQPAYCVRTKPNQSQPERVSKRHSNWRQTKRVGQEQRARRRLDWKGARERGNCSNSTSQYRRCSFGPN